MTKVLIRICKINKKILSINQTMYSPNLGITSQEASFVLECFDKNHQEKIREKLTSMGYRMY